MIVLDSTERFVAILSWIFKDLPFIGRDWVTNGCIAKTLNNPGFMQRVDDGCGLCFWICGGFSGGRRKINLTPLEEKKFSLFLVSHCARYHTGCDVLVTKSTLRASISQVTNPKEELRMQVAKPDSSLAFSKHWIRMNLERVGKEWLSRDFGEEREDNLIEQFSCCFSFDIFHFCWFPGPLSSPVWFKFLQRAVLSAQCKAWFKSWQPDFKDCLIRCFLLTLQQGKLLVPS